MRVLLDSARPTVEICATGGAEILNVFYKENNRVFNSTPRVNDASITLKHSLLAALRVWNTVCCERLLHKFERDTTDTRALHKSSRMCERLSGRRV